ncbi:hypothetical protein GCM10023210_05110 [Chryseobacterium ginsengisoli]|uniref:Uncharacterized protein n=1 Tax=Chryseobacterium ginsengisoli TaxID=363853 RepID=A0ABP9LWG5_9FLAO
MKKKLILICSLVTFSASFAQVGVNTTNPQGIFHVDGAKDNNSTGAPNAAQQVNDFVVTSSGNVGIGTTTPASKMEINSGAANTSGLRLTNLTTASPVSNATGQAIGVDLLGNIVTYPNPTPVSVTTTEVAPTTFTAFNVTGPPALLETIVPGTEQTITIPAGSNRVVFINFMLGLDFTTTDGTGAGYFKATLYIDNVATNVFLTTQEPQARNSTNTAYIGGQQLQYTLNTITELTAGAHTLDIRMVRTFDNGSPVGTVNGLIPISISFNSSYLN